jgi:hypothetical protein
MESPSTGVVLVNVLLVPTIVPFSHHSYAGYTPALAGIAVNVTDDPTQTGLAEAAMATVGFTFSENAIVMAFDVAELALVQVNKGSVVTAHVTTSPDASVDDVN